MNILGIGLLAVFVVKTALDYPAYLKSFTSAPFSVWVMMNAIYFVLPALIVFLLAWHMGKKSQTVIRLVYQITCLDGVYSFTAEATDVVRFEVETDIAKLQSFSGELNARNSRLFREELEKAGIERWDKEYEADQSVIEDGISWQLHYLKGDKEYVSKGVESYQPYGYEHLVKAILLCDEHNDYLF